jgi:hypothetical protein
MTHSDRSPRNESTSRSADELFRQVSFSIIDLDLTRPNEYSKLRFTLEVGLSLYGSIILPIRFEAETREDISCDINEPRVGEGYAYSSMPIHFPAAKSGLVPVHRTIPSPAATLTLLPTGHSPD